MTFVDVGAHIGYFSLVAARRVGTAGRVVAVEPAPDNLELLRSNLARNRASQVEILPVAAGASNRAAELHLTTASDSHGLFPHPLAQSVRTVRVQVKPLDDLLLGPVDLIKIDVEGAELDVLAGMTRILAENPQLVALVEWNPACLRNAGHDPRALPEALHHLGFQLTILDDRSGRSHGDVDITTWGPVGEQPEGWYVNLLGLRR